MSHCPEDETIAAVLDGRLDAAERAQVEAHALRCDACRGALADAARALAADAPVGPSAAAVAKAVAAGTGTDPRSPSRRMRAFVAVGAAVFAAGALAWWSATGEMPGAAPAGGTSVASVPAAPSPAELTVASVSGAVEVQDPRGGEWRPLTTGARLTGETHLRSRSQDPVTVAFASDASVTLLAHADATLVPAPGALSVTLTAGAIFVDPASGGRRVDVAIPQGSVSSPGVPIEVLLRRHRGGGERAMVVSRGEGVVASTPLGRVGLATDHHTMLFADRPPKAPRPFPFKPGERPPRRGFKGDKGERGDRGPCLVPGRPEVERLAEEGP